MPDRDNRSDAAGTRAERSGLGGIIRFSRRAPGIDTAIVEHLGARAELSLYGAHLLSYNPPGGEDLFFLSERSAFIPGSPIRGGIPVCWPWFGPHPSNPALPLHGVARLQAWRLDETALRGDTVSLRLSLESSDATKALWPHDFRLELLVSVGPALSLQLTARNTGTAPWTMTGAFHPYFRVGDIASVRVEGLDGAAWKDRAAGTTGVQSGNLAVSGPIDRIFDASGPLVIRDPALGRSIEMTRSAFPSTVVWNPWEKAASMADLGADAYPRMLCVEPARVAGQDLPLDPGAQATMGFSCAPR